MAYQFTDAAVNAVIEGLSALRCGERYYCAGANIGTGSFSESHLFLVKGVYAGKPKLFCKVSGTQFAAIWWDSSVSKWIMSPAEGIKTPGYYESSSYSLSTAIPASNTEVVWSPQGTATDTLQTYGWAPIAAVGQYDHVLAEAADVNDITWGLEALHTHVTAIPTTPLLAANYTAPPTASTIAAAVWDRLSSLVTTTGSMGKWLLDTMLLRTTWTDTKAGYLDASINTASGYAQTAASLTSTQIADDLLDAAVGDHTSSGTVGEKINAIGSVTLSEADIAAISEGITPPTVDPQVVRDAMLLAPTEGETVEAGSLDGQITALRQPVNIETENIILQSE